MTGWLIVLFAVLLLLALGTLVLGAVPVGRAASIDALETRIAAQQKQIQQWQQMRAPNGEFDDAKSNALRAQLEEANRLLRERSDALAARNAGRANNAAAAAASVSRDVLVERVGAARQDVERLRDALQQYRQTLSAQTERNIAAAERAVAADQKQLDAERKALDDAAKDVKALLLTYGVPAIVLGAVGVIVAGIGVTLATAHAAAQRKRF